MLISPSSLGGTLRPVASKSHLIRLLLAAFLGGKSTVIKGYTPSEDVQATLDCLETLGMGYRIDGRNLYLKPFSPQDSVLQVGESGTLLRLLMPILAAKGITCTIDAKPGLRARPVQTTLELLSTHGVQVKDQYPLSLAGQLQAGTFYVDVTMSSQFLSGFLMALPLLDGDSRVRMVGHPVSIGYVDMTVEVMRLFGVKATPTQDGFVVCGNQTYRTPSELSCEADWSSASFWGVAGALFAPVRLQGLNPLSPHKDKAFAEILAKAGASVGWDNGDLTIAPAPLTAIDWDMRYTPDLAPIVSALCACAKGTSHLKGVGNLRYKECNRLYAIIGDLDNVGIRATYDEDKDVLSIEGGQPKNGQWLGYNDHRMVMTGAILLAKAGGEISDSEAVAKSYPTFWQDYALMGGKA